MFGIQVFGGKKSIGERKSGKNEITNPGGRESILTKNEKCYVPTVTSCQRSKPPATWDPSPSTSSGIPPPFDWVRVTASNRISRKLRKPVPKPVLIHRHPSLLRSLWWTQLCPCFRDLWSDCLNGGICSRRRKDSLAPHNWNENLPLFNCS